MDNTNQQISKKIFRTYFGIFLSLGVFSLVYSGYALYLGLISGEAAGLAFMGLLFYLFIIFIAFIVFLVLIIKNAKSHNKETFLIISKVAIVGEIFVIICASGLALISRHGITESKLRKQESVLAENATSYQNCINMKYFMGECANTVNKKTGDLQGCINLSIDFAKKGGICQRGSFLKDDPVCLEGFGCAKKNTRTFDGHDWVGSNLDSIWVGYADGTYKCTSSYCPPIEQ